VLLADSVLQSQAWTLCCKEPYAHLVIIELLLRQGNVLFVRFYDTPSSGLDRRTPLPSNAEERLRVVLSACVDVPIIMNSLPGAIRTAVAQSRA
jgi:hypothetical protein